MKLNTLYGKVILAGAGPGDPDLITVKALRALQTADVIICDRLVSSELVEGNRKAGSHLIDVGKEGGSPDSTSQITINQLLVEYAQPGKTVLRLKGGDVSFFSNILDELEILTKHGIPYEIIPGVTAASGASALAGIPLTARGYAAGVRFLSFKTQDPRSPDAWAELAATTDTLVFYMASRGLDELVNELIRGNVSLDKNIAIIEQATTPEQYVHVSSIGDYATLLSRKKFQSPTLIIIGAVANLHATFGWKEQSVNRIPYFNSVTRTKKILISA